MPSTALFFTCLIFFKPAGTYQRFVSAPHHLREFLPLLRNKDDAVVECGAVTTGTVGAGGGDSVDIVSLTLALSVGQPLTGSICWL